MTHRAHQWERQTATTSPAPLTAPSIVLVGEAGAAGRTAAHTAEGLASTLEAERAAGRRPVVVWLGDLLLDRRGRLDCAAVSSTWSRKGVDALAEVVREHTRRGGSAYGLPGEAAYRCGARASLRQATDRPTAQPGTHYVVDVLPSGDTRVALSCDGGTCSGPDPDTTPHVQLVFVDLTPWIAGHRPAEHDLDLSSLEALLQRLEAEPGPPRILVANYPVEAAGFHGDSGGDPDSTVHMLPPPVTRALKAGVFVGVLAAHDRATYASSDISDGTIRGDRVFLPHAVFQVVSGSASDPDVRHSWRRLRFNSSNTLVAGRYTPRPGFAVISLSESPSATLHAYRHGRWQRTSVPLSLDPPTRPALVRVPTTVPCLRCPRVPYGEQ